MTNMNLAGLPLSQISPPDPGRRIRLAASVTVYASGLGAAAILVSIITRTDIYDEPEHLTLIPSVVFSLVGALAAALVTPLAIYHVRDRANESGRLLTWLALGLGFGLLWPFVTGAFIPLSLVLISLAEGLIDFRELPSQALDATLSGIRSFFVEGALGLYTGLPAGALFGTGAWVIDRMNASQNPIASKYGTWAIALSLGSTVLALAVFGPPETLRRLA